MKRSAESNDSSPAPAKPETRFRRLVRRIWWLHSLWALAFGIGVMIFAREGLRYAEQLLLLLAGSWFLVFVALRFIVGRGELDEKEKLHKKGLRLITNYVIKNLYQQMLFFLVPLYASSATWSLTSPNWWIVVVLLVFAVLSTMDLVFDNIVMEHRLLASFMYGVCMFGVLNLILPMVFGWPHFQALTVAAGLTAPAVALLSFRVRAVIRPLGLLVTIGAAAGLMAAAWVGRIAIPPAPTAMSAGAIGHGKPGQYECLPGRKRRIPANQLEDLRCVTEIAAPGGLADRIIHRWTLDGKLVHEDVAQRIPGCDGEVLRTRIPVVPAAPIGSWRCTAYTDEGQLLGVLKAEVAEARQPARPPQDAAPARDGRTTLDAGTGDAPWPDAGRDAGSESTQTFDP
ncbi:MAG: DUF2914 domain-containing protein [Deltaproteobacteria bacterium]|nr:DUF2914 domain-containing protein [Deltaproteobacteria bacterium]